VKPVLLEGLLVAILGILLALAANALSPQGLSLQRNYFPAPAAATNAVTPGAGSLPLAGTSTTNSVRDRLLAKGLLFATAADAKAAFDDPAYQQGLIIFIDARADEPYATAHIPGAWQLNYYHPEKHLAGVLPACMSAQKIIIYCTGGDCEDSEFTALLLKNGGVPAERLFVFGGGVTEWAAQPWPLESGGRNSGLIKSRP